MKWSAAATLCAVIFGGCNATNDVSQMSPPEVFVHAHFMSKFSDEVPTETRLTIKRDLIDAYERQIDVVADSWFDKIFGGTTSTHVLRYLDERIHYIFPPSTQILLFNGASSITDPAQNVANAVNFSRAYWLQQVSIFPRALYFEFNDERIRVRSTRDGILQLGTPHLNDPPMKRIGTLIHEARHSDCKGGLNASDVTRVKAGQNPLNLECGYEHVICPSRYVAPNGSHLYNPYAGLPACDVMPWGAYAVEAVYQASVYESCTSCTQEEKQLALMISQDSFMRSNDITPQMLRGRLGNPDMTSSNHFERGR